MEFLVLHCRHIYNQILLNIPQQAVGYSFHEILIFAYVDVWRTQWHGGCYEDNEKD